MSEMRQKFCDIHGLMFHDDCDDHPEFESFTLGYQAATEAAKATSVAEGELPKWIDDQKGKDPLMDDMIHYIETLHAEAARQPAPVAETKPQIIPDWPFCNPGCDYETPIGGHIDGRSETCSCDPAKASICRQRAALAATAAPVAGMQEMTMQEVINAMRDNNLLTDIGYSLLLNGEPMKATLEYFTQVINFAAIPALAATRSQP